jgi:uncharacterized protein YhjY with autotransporter beta-barrel domain
MTNFLWRAGLVLALNVAGLAVARAIVITPNNAAGDLAAALAGPGVTVHNPTYTGAAEAVGTFSGGYASGLRIDSGIILSTGNVVTGMGPNNNTSAGTNLGFGGDPDIDAITGLANSQDAASLSFDFETDTGNVFINFIFATEEFFEFIGSGYNDTFAFLVDGVNIALIPNTALPVTLNNLGLNGFNNNSGGHLDVQYDGVTNAYTAQLMGLAAGLHTFKLVIADLDDGGLDSAVFIQAGSLAAVEVPLGESEEPVLTILGVSASRDELVTVDIGAISSAVSSGLPMGLAQRSLVENATRTLTRDVGSRLYRLRALGLEEPAAPDQRFSYFASGDFGFLDRNQTDTLVGFNSNSRSGTNGFEFRLNENVTLGLAGGYVDTDGDIAEELGSATVKGFAASPYVTYTKAPFYADVLYSFASYEHELRRKTGLGRTARAEPESQNHFLQFNTGYNWKFGNLVTGPALTVDYLYGELDGYTETGGANANLIYEAQEYDSLITRVGWTASYKIEVGSVDFIPQLRAFWERENLDDPDEATATLANSPTTIVTSSGSRKGKGFTAHGSEERPDSDYITLGAGLRIRIADKYGVVLDYEGQFGREQETAHFGSVKFDMPF